MKSSQLKPIKALPWAGKKGFMRPNIQRHLAAAKKGSQASQAPGQEPGGPTLAGKRDWGPVGGSSELKEGGCLMVWW